MSTGAGHRTDRLQGLREYVKKALREVRVNLNVLLKWRPGLRDGAEVLLIASTLPLYYLVRGVTHAQIPQAVSRGISIVHLEQSLGIFWEPQLQHSILSYDWMVTALNALYLYGHLPVIGALAVWLYFWHRPQYLLMRNAFLISGAIALIIFVNFPTAPPRLLPSELGFGFVDTIFREYKASRPDTPSFFVNEYAAMPSMHIGWNLLAGIAIWLASRNIFIRAFAVLMPLAMVSDIILTANHYILDAAAGLGVMLIGLGIAVAARILVVRIFSPDGKLAREKGWVGWLYWLCGVPSTAEQQPALSGQAA